MLKTGLKSLSKSVVKSGFVKFLASELVAAYIGLMRRFARLESPEMAHFEGAIAKGQGAICVFWHQRLVLSTVITHLTPVPLHMLITTSRDGGIVVRGVRGLGVNFIRGSAANPTKRFKDKSGAPALIQMITALRAGEIIAITPDGPRGPARKIQPGVVKLAARTGAPIIVVGLSARSGKHLRSWDRLYLPNPLATKTIITGAPLYIARDASADELEEKCLMLEQSLDAITDLADRKVGKKVGKTSLKRHTGARPL